MPTTRLIFRFRLAMAFFIFGLVLSGITAFPLKWEADRIAKTSQINSKPPAVM